MKLTDQAYQTLLEELGEEECRRCIDYVDESAQSTGNKNRWSDWALVVRKCHRDGWGLKTGRQEEGISRPAAVPPKSAAEDMERMRRILALSRQEDQKGGEGHG